MPHTNTHYCCCYSLHTQKNCVDEKMTRTRSACVCVSTGAVCVCVCFVCVRASTIVYVRACTCVYLHALSKSGMREQDSTWERFAVHTERKSMCRYNWMRWYKDDENIYVLCSKGTCLSRASLVSNYRILKSISIKTSARPNREG